MPPLTGFWWHSRQDCALKSGPRPSGIASNSSNFAWSAWCVGSSATPLLLSSKPVGAGGAGLEVGGPEVGGGPAEHAVATRLRPKAATPIKVFMAPSGASCESANLCLSRRYRQTRRSEPAHRIGKMPFAIPYGAPISLEHAEAAIAATVAEARKQDWKLNVAVVDSGGNLVAFQRMDGRSSRQSRSPSTRRALPPPSVAKRRCSRTPFSRAI